MLFMITAQTAVVRTTSIDIGPVDCGNFPRQAEFIPIEPINIATDKVLAHAMLRIGLLKIDTFSFGNDFCSNDFQAIRAQRLRDTEEIMIAILH